MHSHLLPGIDDGVKTNEEAFATIDQLIALGYEKIVTTPHIMIDYYGNTAESITEAYEKFVPALRSAGYTIPFQAAAEYYFDENLVALLKDKKKILTFGDNHFLFETNFLSEPMRLNEMIFSATSQGYKPILAHPERYEYMTLEKADDIRSRGVSLQINMLSLIGGYGPTIQKMAEKLIKKGWVDLLGTDCHNPGHAFALRKVQGLKSYRAALELPLLNYTL